VQGRLPLLALEAARLALALALVVVTGGWFGAPLHAAIVIAVTTLLLASLLASMLLLWRNWPLQARSA
jgi:hypothetical protein